MRNDSFNQTYKLLSQVKTHHKGFPRGPRRSILYVPDPANTGLLTNYCPFPIMIWLPALALLLTANYFLRAFLEQSCTKQKSKSKAKQQKQTNFRDNNVNPWE